MPASAQFVYAIQALAGVQAVVALVDAVHAARVAGIVWKLAALHAHVSMEAWCDCPAPIRPVVEGAEVQVVEVLVPVVDVGGFDMNVLQASTFSRTWRQGLQY
ncbi:MAG: hypothetical protein QM777_15210 [Pseudorhodoferax sp.]